MRFRVLRVKRNIQRKFGSEVGHRTLLSEVKHRSHPDSRSAPLSADKDRKIGRRGGSVCQDCTTYKCVTVLRNPICVCAGVLCE